MAVLTTLTSLPRLHLVCNHNLPACLSTLTWLEQLEVLHLRPVNPALEVALPLLVNLTCLSLCCNDYRRIPPALAQLPRLQRLCFDAKPAAAAAEDFSLPQPAWLASIRWLGLPWVTLRQAVGWLPGAVQLEYLCSLGLPPFPGGAGSPSCPSEQQGKAFWRFVATHPLLRCLGLQEYDEDQSHKDVSVSGVIKTLLYLRHRRPDLSVRHLQPRTCHAEVVRSTAIPTAPVFLPPF